MKEKLASLLLFYILLGVISPNLNLISSDFLENNITFINSEIDGETDEKESESEKKILPNFKSLIPANISKNSSLIFFGKNAYASIVQNHFSPPPEV